VECGDGCESWEGQHVVPKSRYQPRMTFTYEDGEFLPRRPDVNGAQAHENRYRQPDCQHDLRARKGPSMRSSADVRTWNVNKLARSCGNGRDDHVTAVIDGPAWSVPGLVPHDNRYPLKVETAVQRAVSLLLPGVSTASELVRYYALYAALAAYAEDHGLGGEECRELVRRSEVVLAGASLLEADDPPGPVRVHGADGVRPWFGDALDVLGAVDMGNEKHSYSSRKSGFWGTYCGPSQVLGTVMVEDNAFRTGRHACPTSVRELFAPLFSAAGHDRLSRADLEVCVRSVRRAASGPRSRGCWNCSPRLARGSTSLGNGSPMTSAGGRPCGYSAGRRYCTAWIPA